MLDNRVKGIIVGSIAFLLLLAIAVPVIQANSTMPEKQTVPPPFDFDNPPPGSMTMDQLMEQASSDSSTSTEDLNIRYETIDDWK
jgi:hypothetical protein